MPRRIVQSRVWFATVLGLMIAIAASVALVISVARDHEARIDTDTKICLATNRLVVPIRASLQRALVTLPTLSYYKEHPDELAIQLAEVRRNLRAFRTLDCS
jgi:hypothetical protein